VRIDQILAAFTKSQLQTFRNILQVLALNERTIVEALEYVNVITQPKQGVRLAKFCPECESPMRLFQVNTPNRATEVGGGYKSQWQCLGCGHDIFSKNTIQEEIDKARRLQNGTR